MNLGFTVDREFSWRDHLEDEYSGRVLWLPYQVEIPEPVYDSERFAFVHMDELPTSPDQLVTLVIQCDWPCYVDTSIECPLSDALSFFIHCTKYDPWCEYFEGSVA